MSTSRKIEKNPERQFTWLDSIRHTPSSHMYTHSLVDPYRYDAVSTGIRSVVKALNGGALSEEQAVDIIRFLATAYTSELISQRVGDYLEGGLSHVIRQHLEEWMAVGRQQGP